MTAERQDPVVRPLQDRTAVLVLRVWVVQEEPRQLRARVLHAKNADDEPASVATAGSVEDICAAVREWLDHFLAG